MSRTIRFTDAEIAELLRALRLIKREDEGAGINMDAASVKAKTSALAKLEQAE